MDQGLKVNLNFPNSSELIFIEGALHDETRQGWQQK